METKTLPQNGKASKAGASANSAANGKETSATNSESKDQAAAIKDLLTDKETPTQPEALAPLSVEDKIKKVDTLNALIAKRGVLKSHLDRVEALKFGDYEEKTALPSQAVQARRTQSNHPYCASR